MPQRRDPNFLTGHLCRFCGQPVPWGTILRLLRVDPDTPPYMPNESACHTNSCLGSCGTCRSHFTVIGRLVETAPRTDGTSR